MDIIIGASAGIALGLLVGCVCALLGGTARKKLLTNNNMQKEIIRRFWRFVYSNSHEEPFAEGKSQGDLTVKEKNCEWEAVRLFWRFYWVTYFTS